MRVTLFDYGTGNLHSLTKALESFGAEVRVEAEATSAIDADALVLPGVGAFGAAAARLAPGRQAVVAALESGLPCIGICLGMQLLFDGSEESPGDGLGFIDGRVRRLRAHRVPQMGWNDLEITGGAAADPLFTGLRAPVVYYANTYVPEPVDPTVAIAATTYADDRFVAAVRRGNTWGVQFHPEKSADVGLRMIGNFLEAAR